MIRPKDEIFGIVRQLCPFLETVQEQTQELSIWFQSNGYQNVKVHEYSIDEDPKDFISRHMTSKTKYIITTDIAIYGESLQELCLLKSWSGDKPFTLLSVQLTPETPETYLNFTWELQAIQAQGRKVQRLKLLNRYKTHVEEIHEKEGNILKIKNCNTCNMRTSKDNSYECK